MTPDPLHFNRLVQALVMDGQREPLPSHMTDLPGGSLDAVYRVIDWDMVKALSFYRRNTGTEVDEPPSAWGNVLILQMMLALGVHDLAPQFARQLEAAAPLLLGPPHSSDRMVWNHDGLMPARYERRFLALRRRAHLWMAREPQLLNRLVVQLEEKIHKALRVGPRVGAFTTTIDIGLLETEYDGDQSRSRGPVKLAAVRTPGAEEELAVICRQERHGCVTQFGTEHNLYQNYVCVKLSNYVREVWDLQEDTPALPYSTANGEQIPDDFLVRGTSAVRAWLNSLLEPAGAKARQRVLEALGQPDVPDLAVYYRKRTALVPTTPRKNHAKLYTVKPPPTVAAAAGFAKLTVRAVDRGLFLNPAELGTTFDKLRADYVALGADELTRKAQFDAGMSRVGMTRFVKTTLVAETIREPILARWFDDEFNVEPAAWIERHLKAMSAERRAEGERVRKAHPFTTDEDVKLRSLTSRTSKSVWDQLAAAWPHHSLRRIQCRSKLLIALKRKGAPTDQPVTEEFVRRYIPRHIIRRYERAL